MPIPTSLLNLFRQLDLVLRTPEPADATCQNCGTTVTAEQMDSPLAAAICPRCGTHVHP